MGISSHRTDKKKSTPNQFEMNGVELAAFNDLRKALISLPDLLPSKLNVPIILKVDCSQFCSGTALVQENELGQEHSVAYFAKENLPRETNFSIAGRECLGV